MPRRAGTRGCLYQGRPGDARPPPDEATATAKSDSDRDSRQRQGSPTATARRRRGRQGQATGATATGISDSDSGSRPRYRPATRRETICRDARIPQEAGYPATKKLPPPTSLLFLPASNVSPSLPSQISKGVIDLRRLFLLLGLLQDRTPGPRDPVALLGAPRLVGDGRFQ